MTSRSAQLPGSGGQSDPLRQQLPGSCADQGSGAADQESAWIRRVEWGAEPVAGPLHGLRFAIKDNIDLIGYPTTAACPDLATRPAATVSAVAVQRLVDAGAVPAGKTNLDQFAT